MPESMDPFFNPSLIRGTAHASIPSILAVPSVGKPHSSRERGKAPESKAKDVVKIGDSLVGGSGHRSSRSLDTDTLAKSDIQTLASLSEPVEAISAPLPTPVVKASALLVDDNAVNLRLLSTFMTKVGRRYTLAENGLVALDKYKSAVPAIVVQAPELSKGFVAYEVVFMDLNMPVMDVSRFRNRAK